MNIEEMIIKHSLKPVGVIQVGSHHGEEIPVWERLRIKHVHFEPVRANYTKMFKDFPGVELYPVALGANNWVVTMNCETVNGGQSCSVLEPREHLKILPWIVFDRKEKVPMVRLDEFYIKDCNFMFIDAQGYEIEILLGGSATLRGMDFLFTEVNRAEVFENCSQIEHMDEYLGSRGFKRVETEWHGGVFGDALYVRR